jgi:hypothetical protein
MEQKHGFSLWQIAGLIVTAVILLETPAYSQTSSVEGTWRLVARDLPDGTHITPPQVMGMFSLAKGQRNLNVLWYTPEGKPASYSLMSTYTLTNREYTETLLFSIFNDPGNPQTPIYNLSAETKTMPVTSEGRKISIKLPFDAPTVEFDGDRLTATVEGVFVDHWEKIKFSDTTWGQECWLAYDRYERWR